jgi:hypothetical protein
MRCVTWRQQRWVPVRLAASPLPLLQRRRPPNRMPLDHRAMPGAVPTLAVAACVVPCLVWRVAPAWLHSTSGSAVHSASEPEPEPEPELEPAPEPAALPPVPPQPEIDPCLPDSWPACDRVPPPGFGDDGFVILPNIVDAVRKRMLSLHFPCVCPEPVLVKSAFSSRKHTQRRRCRRFRRSS